LAGQVPQGVIAKPLQGAEREAKDRTGTEIAATRVPKGNPRGREAPESPTRALEEARAGLLGLCRQPRGCRVGTRVPVAPSLALPAGLVALGSRQ